MNRKSIYIPSPSWHQSHRSRHFGFIAIFLRLSEFDSCDDPAIPRRQGENCIAMFFFSRDRSADFPGETPKIGISPGKSSSQKSGIHNFFRNCGYFYA
jgi:hypothetical protein